MTYIRTFIIVAFAYIFAHGLTSSLITPLQSRILPDITGFASLVYLPHGVRVLSTWLLNKSALLPLCVGAFCAEVLFTQPIFSRANDPIILISIAVGVSSAFAAFELTKLFGRNYYAGQSMSIHWSKLLAVGAIASVINSIGQSLVFHTEIVSGHNAAVMATYALGDLIGLIVTTLVLMLVFRWIRLTSRSKGR